MPYIPLLMFGKTFTSHTKGIKMAQFMYPDGYGNQYQGNQQEAFAQFGCGLQNKFRALQQIGQL